MSEKIRLLLVDDDEFFLQSLSKLLNQQADFQVSAAVTDGRAALDAALKYPLDLALVDIDMPGMDGIETAKALLKARPRLTVVMLTAFANEKFLPAALVAGAKGFLTKDTPVDELGGLLHKAHAGAVVMGQRALDIITDNYKKEAEEMERHADYRAAVEALPEYLLPTFNCLLEGLPNKIIARELGLSDATVRFYVSEILTRTNCTSRLEVAIKALRSNL